jgi:hypothetical protein
MTISTGPGLGDPGDSGTLDGYVIQAAAVLDVSLADFDVAATAGYLAGMLRVLRLVESVQLPNEVTPATIFRA